MTQILRIVLIWITVLPLLFGYRVGHAQDRIDIRIVKSSNNSYYNQTIQTLTELSNSDLIFQELDLPVNTEDIDALAQSDLIITLGAAATDFIGSRLPDKKLISTYITEQQLSTLNLPHKKHLAILLDQPLSRYLTFSHLVINAESIGIANRSALQLSKKQRKLLAKLNIELRQYQLEQAGSTITRIRQLTRQNAALLMMPDQTIYNRDTLRGVLLTSYRNRTPAVSYSPAHVKSGALASIYSSPVDIGRHIADLLNQGLKKVPFSKESKHYARYYSMMFNKRVAYALGLSIPSEERIRQRLEEVLK